MPSWEAVHRCNSSPDFSQNIKEQWTGNTSKWLTSSPRTLPTTFHTITDTGERLQRKPNPFIVGIPDVCTLIYVYIAIKVLTLCQLAEQASTGHDLNPWAVPLWQHLITSSVLLGKYNSSGLWLEMWEWTYMTQQTPLIARNKRSEQYRHRFPLPSRGGILYILWRFQ